MTKQTNINNQQTFTCSDAWSELLLIRHNHVDFCVTKLYFVMLRYAIPQLHLHLHLHCMQYEVTIRTFVIFTAFAHA